MIMTRLDYLKSILPRLKYRSCFASLITVTKVSLSSALASFETFVNFAEIFELS